MTTKINIAIDGHSSCGKGTLARYLANELDYHFIDTGAMYRGVTYAFHKENIELSDNDAIKTLLQAQHLKIEYVSPEDGLDITFKGTPINKEIRLPYISNMVSQVSELALVRSYLVEVQQEMAKGGGVVMDGRDIGTNVIPNAELKIFMTADPKIRAQRRFDELSRKEVNVSYDQVLENILFRDKTDSTRAINPLVAADDARVLDNSAMSIEEQNKLALNWAKEVLSK